MAQTKGPQAALGPKPSARDRVSIVYRDRETNQDSELPLKILVIANFAGVADAGSLDHRLPIAVEERNLGEVLAGLGARARFECLGVAVDLWIRSFVEFGPAAVAAEVPWLRERIAARSTLVELVTNAEFDQLDQLDHSLHEWFGESLDPVRDRISADLAIVALDQVIADQLDAILHHPEFQALESAWRALAYLLGQIDFSENIEVNLLDCRKQELVDDFEDAPEIIKSALHRLIYATEYGTFGGQPYGVIVCDFEFDSGPADVGLLGQCASVAAMAHVPFIANASPRLFGERDFDALTNYTDIRAGFATPQYARWTRFRSSEDARYVGLCLPRFLLRGPYQGSHVESFRYAEQTAQKSDYLWGRAAFAFATRVAESFARYRWGPNIVGPTAGGAVQDLPRIGFASMRKNHDPDDRTAIEHRMSIEIQLTERQEFELSEVGLIGLAYLKASELACFFSASSCQQPKVFGNSEADRAQSLGARLGAQLPYVFIVSRIAHYLKVLQREQIGRHLERGDLERELDEWLRQYVSEMDNPAPAIRGKRPLRAAQIVVEEVPGQAGWYRAQLSLRPHLQYMGASFTLSLVAKLERE